MHDLIGEAAHSISTRAVDLAVRFTEYQGRECGGWEAYYQAPDGGCYLLPTGDGFRIRQVADTCRSSFLLVLLSYLTYVKVLAHPIANECVGWC
jgi:hypothetical protein